MTDLYLVVARGRDAGARLRLDAGDLVVGRARDADLVLLDRRVSRRHLRVRTDGQGARVTVLEDAAPFLIAGVAQSDTTLRVGDTLVVGDTALVLARMAEQSASTGGHSTELRSLMTGLAADVRGLAAAMELVEALDAAQDEDGVLAALDPWARRTVGATDVKILVGEAIDEELAAAGPRSLVERPGPSPDARVLLAPAHATEPAWVAITCAGAVTDTTRRLIAVAARLCASVLARVHALRVSRDDRDSLRLASVGSARTFLGSSPAALEVAKLATRLAASDVVVLLEGETGAGKTFVARLIHESGSRSEEPLRVLNCAAIPETLLESELFGHERGAFTGAAATKPGALESAGRGTVLLDEIGELPLASQAKLLRVLEDRRFERLGSNKSIRLEARVLAATNRDLAEMVTAGTFRADLFYRIAVVKLRVPPLRDRGDDLVLLAERLLADLSASAGRRVRGFSPEALDLVKRYPWPGNVRELRNAVERALAVGDGPTIQPGDLPETLHTSTPPQPADPSMVTLPARLDWLEKRAIEAALRATGGNQRRAAVLLGINRVTLHRKLKAEGLASGDDGDED
jgi:DNA-binding NtrC family response regulator/pSer/pThr/pTyr-binding forkhead associated (FHA) protein